MRIGSFGPVIFESSIDLIRNFGELGEDRGARFATHDVLNLEQKLQFLGINLMQCSVPMSFHHRFCDIEAELGALRELLAGHESHDLQVGGTYLGLFVAESLRITWRRVTARGELLSASAEVKLKEYK